MYTLPQEIEVWYIIPAIRRGLARCLTGHHGVSYDNVGKMLGISKAAISQYVNNKRAAKIQLPEQALKEIGKACDKLVADYEVLCTSDMNRRKGTRGDGDSRKVDAVKEITRILKFIRDKKLVLEVCDKHDSGVLEGCKEIRFDGEAYLQ
jgi:predicted transcriptional regulator